MKATALLYAAVGGAALFASVILPWMVHSAGSEAVPGWKGFVNPGPLSRSHAFIGKQCETCHAPHQGVDDRKCVTCHASTAFKDKPSTRFHIEAKTCRTCHVEHEGAAAPTVMDHAALLRPDVWKMPRPAAAGEKPRTVLNDMVTWSKGRAADQLSDLECSTCHSVKDVHQGLFGQQCSACHAVKAWAVPSFRHPASNSTLCAECHRPPPSHTMMHFTMMSQKIAGKRAKVEQCYACHTTDSWNNIRGVGPFDHH